MSMSLHGTRVVQLLIHHLTLIDKEPIIIWGLGEIMNLIKDNSGFHVLIAIAEEIIAVEKSICKDINSPTFSNKKISINILHNFIMNNIEEICFDKYGCCYAQKYISITYKNHQTDIIELIKSKATLFIDHVYANYVIQFIIGMNIPDYNNFFIKILSNNFFYYATNKSTSNLIEKLLQVHIDQTTPNGNCNEMIQNAIQNEEGIKQLVLDCYGNYGRIFL